MLKQRWITALAALSASWLVGTAAWAQGTQAPDALVKQLSSEVLESVKSDKAIQAGDRKKLLALVDGKILPHVNLARMTDEALGRYRSQATPEQKQRLQDEYKQLMVYTYAGAFRQVKDQTLKFLPYRAAADAGDVTVKTQLVGGGEPVNLNYFLEKNADGWKIYDLDAAGVRLSLTYKSQFEREIGASGVDGLITKLAERNKALASRS